MEIIHISKFIETWGWGVGVGGGNKVMKQMFWLDDRVFYFAILCKLLLDVMFTA
jgi:hypothetical protein